MILAHLLSGGPATRPNSLPQLREVGGIGESKFAALKNKVRV